MARKEMDCQIIVIFYKKPVEFDVLFKIYANDRNGLSSTILKWMLDMQQLPVTISKNGLTVLLYYSTESQV